MFMLLLCIYVCKYIYLCVRVCVYIHVLLYKTCTIALDPSVTITAVEVDFYPSSFYQPWSNYLLIFLDLKRKKGKKKNWTNTKKRNVKWVRSFICLASLSTTVTLKRQTPPQEGTCPPCIPLLACFRVYLHVLWLFYSIEKKKPAATVWWSIKACGSR